jgi:hypothetical protein
MKIVFSVVGKFYTFNLANEERLSARVSNKNLRKSKSFGGWNDYVNKVIEIYSRVIQCTQLP